LNPAETVTIGIGFNTNEIPASGDIKLTVEVVGGNQKDTLSFSASTLYASVNKNFAENKMKMYPCPASSQLFFDSPSPEDYEVSITDLHGKEIYLSEIACGSNRTLSIEHLLPGKYIVRIKYKSGNIEIRNLIKN
jgi:hypothetical protein